MPTPEFDVYCMQSHSYTASKVPVEEATAKAKILSEQNPGFDYMVVTATDTPILLFRGGKRFCLIQA